MLKTKNFNKVKSDITYIRVTWTCYIKNKFKELKLECGVVLSLWTYWMVHYCIFCIAQFRLHRSSIESVYIEITVNIEVTAIVGLIQYS